MSKYFVYRFIDIEDNIIYVGKTKNMRTRMYTHFNRGHLPKECYGSVEKVEMIELNNKLDMDIKEIYYIDLYKPKYNTINKLEGNMASEFKEKDKWIEYTVIDDSYVNKLKECIKRKDREIERLNDEIESHKNKVKELNETINSKNADNFLRESEESIKLHQKLKDYVEGKKKAIGSGGLVNCVNKHLDDNPNDQLVSRLYVNGVKVRDYLIYADITGHHFIERISGRTSEEGYKKVNGRYGIKVNKGLLRHAEDWVIIGTLGAEVVEEYSDGASA